MQHDMRKQLFVRIEVPSDVRGFENLHNNNNNGGPRAGGRG